MREKYIYLPIPRERVLGPLRFVVWIGVRGRGAAPEVRGSGDPADRAPASMCVCPWDRAKGGCAFRAHPNRPADRAPASLCVRPWDRATGDGGFLAHPNKPTDRAPASMCVSPWDRAKKHPEAPKTDQERPKNSLGPRPT